MTTMLEKMAQAMELALRESAAVDYTEPYVDEGDRGLIIDGCFDLKVVARAALEAIREPDEVMINGGVTGLAGENCAGRPVWAKGVGGCYTAMIDTILNEKTP